MSIPHEEASAAGQVLPERPASIVDAYCFFLPLMLTAELMMLSHATVTAFLARMPAPAPTLAAFSIAFYLHAALGSPVWACQIIALSFIRDRASLRTLLLFSFQVAASVAWIWILIGATPAGDWFFASLFGTSEPVARAAKLCTLISLAMIPLVTVRSLAYALMMVMRRTMLVTYGSAIRIIVLFVLLILLTRHREGAVIGVIALVGCILAETVYSVIAARPIFMALPARRAEPPSYRHLWRFGWPIMLMQLAESGVAFTVNFFLGRLVRPELALAAFGVLDSIVRVLLSPLRNLILATQTLVRSRADMRVLALFAAQVAALFCALMLLFYGPSFRDWVLFDVIGLPAEIAAYVADALRVGFLLALGMAAVGLTRGLLIASRHTGAIAVAAGVRVGAVVVAGVSCLALGISNGAMVGIVALITAFATEAAVLSIHLYRLDRSGSGLFRVLHGIRQGNV